jgi:hypothetical protein
VRSSSSFARTFLRGTLAITVVAALASCGSRTGLFGPEPDDIVDASADVQGVDASIDGRPDGQPDAPFDVKLDAPVDGPLVCVPGTFNFTLATPQLMFVLDRSGSMAYSLTTNTPPPPNQPTRWIALRDALQQSISSFSSSLAMGARFYPIANANAADPVSACSQDPGVGIPPALNNAQNILNVFNQSSPVGGTPTAIALQLAVSQISSSRAIARAMVLATDGAPNCNAALNGQTCTCTSTTPAGCTGGVNGSTNCLDDTRTVQTISDTFNNKKIPVFVVGIGVTQSFGNVLDKMAVAGGRARTGTPKYYQADTPQDLVAAFTVVRDSVAKCTYITPSAPDDADAISVVIGGKQIIRDKTHVNGWDWVDQAYGQLQLYGSACDQATAVNVSGTIGCKGDE